MRPAAIIIVVHHLRNVVLMVRVVNVAETLTAQMIMCVVVIIVVHQAKRVVLMVRVVVIVLMVRVVNVAET